MRRVVHSRNTAGNIVTQIKSDSQFPLSDSRSWHANQFAEIFEDSVPGPRTRQNGARPTLFVFSRFLVAFFVAVVYIVSRNIRTSMYWICHAIKLTTTTLSLSNNRNISAKQYEHSVHTGYPFLKSRLRMLDSV